MMVVNNYAPTRFRDVDIGDVFSYDNNGLSPVSYYMRIQEVRNYNAVDLDTGALYILEDTDIVEIYPDAAIYMHPIKTDEDEDTVEFYDDGGNGFAIVKHKCKE